MMKCIEQIAYSGHDRLHQAREVFCGDDGVRCGKCVAALEAEVAELKAAVEWFGQHRFQIGQSRSGNDIEYAVVQNIGHGGSSYQIGNENPTVCAALLAAYRAHIEREANHE